MKLFFSPASPFARKVLACAIARGIDGQITVLPTVRDDPALIEQNPLTKIPCLVTEDGVALFDSRVICEFLDTVGDVAPMFPAHGTRVRALLLQAIGDGICDAAVLRRGEMALADEPGRAAHIERQRLKVVRSLDVLAADPPAKHLDIGTIAVACALGYLDFRYPGEPWREGRSALAAWFEAISQEACLVQTQPPG